jgi:hypothetical protein
MIAKDVGEVQHAKDKREHTEYDGTYVNWAGPHWLGPSFSAVFGSFVCIIAYFSPARLRKIQDFHQSTTTAFHKSNKRLLVRLVQRNMKW